MGTVTTRPDGVLDVYAVATNTGWSADAVARDNNDGTYFEFTDAFSSRLYMSCGDPPIPAGCVMRTVTARVRWSTWSGTSPAQAAGIQLYVTNGTYSPGTIPGITDPGAQTLSTQSTAPIESVSRPVNTPNLAQGYLNGMAMGVNPSGATKYARIHETYLDFLYASPPTVVATGPTGTLRINNPTVTWVHQPGADAVSGQDQYRVRVYDLANPSVIVYDTGNVAGAASSAVVGPLALQKNYRAYVNTMQTTNGVGQWSADSATDFTLDVTGPTVVVNAPTGVIGTTSPAVTWTHTPGAGAQTGQTQYRIRAFNVTDLVTPLYDTGVVASSASSQVIGPLDPAISWRVVVNTAQTTYGVLQWSPDAFKDFTIDVVAPLISTVAATPNNSTGSIALLISRNTSTPLWQTMDVEVTHDGGTTWIPVRGASNVAVNGATANLIDYEAPNGQPVQYRARATRVSSGISITGAWVLSGVVTWTDNDACTGMWLKDPAHPSRNMHLDAQLPDRLYDRVVGVFRPIGATYPVVVSDVLQAFTTALTIVTRNDADAAKLRTIVQGNVLLLQTPATAGWQWGSRYVAPGALTEAHTSPGHLSTNRVWTLAVVEVARPPDDGVA